MIETFKIFWASFINSITKCYYNDLNQFLKIERDENDHKEYKKKLVQLLLNEDIL